MKAKGKETGISPSRGEDRARGLSSSQLGRSFTRNPGQEAGCSLKVTHRDDGVQEPKLFISRSLSLSQGSTQLPFAAQKACSLGLAGVVFYPRLSVFVLLDAVLKW